MIELHDNNYDWIIIVWMIMAEAWKVPFSLLVQNQNLVITSVMRNIITLISPYYIIYAFVIWHNCIDWKERFGKRSTCVGLKSVIIVCLEKRNPSSCLNKIRLLFQSFETRYKGNIGIDIHVYNLPIARVIILQNITRRFYLTGIYSQ